MLSMVVCLFCSYIVIYVGGDSPLSPLWRVYLNTLVCALEEEQWTDESFQSIFLSIDLTISISVICFSCGLLISMLFSFMDVIVLVLILFLNTQALNLGANIS